MILHHGGGSRLESWTSAGWVNLLATDHQVVSFDARGNGESDKPTHPDDYGLDLMVSDVLPVADACEAERFHYLGWSLGGKVGWGLADQAQDRLASLALIGAEPDASGETASAMIALVESGMDAVADAMSQMWQMPDWALHQQRQNEPEAILAYFHAAWPDLTHVPGHLGVPSLLICGSEDEVRDAMARAARRARSAFVRLDDEDHMTSFLSARARIAYRDLLGDPPLPLLRPLRPRSPVMAFFNGAFPILPGKTDAARSFASEVVGERRSAFEEFQRRTDVTRETWSIQELPDGAALMLVWFEAADPGRVFAELAQDSSEFPVWFRERVQEINGIDLTRPPEGGPQVALDWVA